MSLIHHHYHYSQMSLVHHLYPRMSITPHLFPECHLFIIVALECHSFIITNIEYHSFVTTSPECQSFLITNRYHSFITTYLEYHWFITTSSECQLFIITNLECQPLIITRYGGGPAVVFQVRLPHNRRDSVRRTQRRDTRCRRDALLRYLLPHFPERSDLGQSHLLSGAGTGTWWGITEVSTTGVAKHLRRVAHEEMFTKFSVLVIVYAAVSRRMRGNKWLNWRFNLFVNWFFK